MGQRAAIYDSSGRVVGHGTWQEQKYLTPEGSEKSFLTVVPVVPNEEKKVIGANAQRLDKPLRDDLEYDDNGYLVRK